MKKKKKGNSAVLKNRDILYSYLCRTDHSPPSGMGDQYFHQTKRRDICQTPQMDSGGSDYCKLYPCIDRELHTQGFFKQSVGWPDDIPHSTSSGRKCRICVRQI